MEPIEFYLVNEPYGCFSNFSRHGFELEGLYWPTAEHYFQAQKFARTEHARRIATARTPKEAARLGRARVYGQRVEPEEVAQAHPAF